MPAWPYRGSALLISPLSPEGIGIELSAMGAAAPASAVWPTANKAFFYPVYVSTALIVNNLWVLNGATAASNWDVGIYDTAGAKIVSTGTTAQSGTNVVQKVTITETFLAQGTYYLGMAAAAATLTVFRTAPAAGLLRAAGMFVKTTAFVLPTSVAFAVQDAAHCPIFGLGVRVTV